MKDERVFSELLQINYISHPNNKYMATDAGTLAGPNIGMNGERLTITFLSMNRVELSKRLSSSIRDQLTAFKGKVLIVDNGSNQAELQSLYDHMANMPYEWEIIELGYNYGVAAGRNITMDHVNTDWVMFLDNDIYLIKNPLPVLQAEISVLGTHFITLPLINEGRGDAHLRGGTIYISATDNGLAIGAGSTMPSNHTQNEHSMPSLGTFLAGGACIVKKETFLKAGAYDTAMFIGFEDIEFSVRLFQEGYKIGSSECLAFIHDHPAPTGETDKAYEHQRFTKTKLLESANHFERKHGFIVWTKSVNEWIDKRQEELDIAQNHGPHNIKETNLADNTNSKPVIGIIIDVSDWAFARIAQQIATHMSDSYDFIIVASTHYSTIDEIFHQLRYCDLIHIFWRQSLSMLGKEKNAWVHELYGGYDSFYNACIRDKKITTTVYDHLFLGHDEIEENNKIFNEIITSYTVSSQKLNDKYREISQYPKPFSVTTDGVDLSHYRPLNLPRLQELHTRELVVGWVGNSNWNSESGKDHKGFNSILMPVLERLKAQGHKIKWQFADRASKQISQDLMPAYYAEIDVLICASSIEGTPNPVLEAMACGVPVISTDVGIVREAFGELQKKFILKKRDQEELHKALLKLLHKPSIAQQLSKENLRSIQSWCWREKVKEFHAFFEHVLQQ